MARRSMLHDEWNALPDSKLGVATWYRYDDTYFTSTGIKETELYVVKATERGVWLKTGYWYPACFVLNEATKRYAYPTRELAWNSFQIRKRKHLGHLRARLSRAEEAYELSKAPSYAEVKREARDEPFAFDE